VTNRSRPFAQILRSGLLVCAMVLGSYGLSACSPAKPSNDAGRCDQGMQKLNQQRVGTKPLELTLAMTLGPNITDHDVAISQAVARGWTDPQQGSLVYCVLSAAALNHDRHGNDKCDLNPATARTLDVIFDVNLKYEVVDRC